MLSTLHTSTKCICVSSVLMHGPQIMIDGELKRPKQLVTAMHCSTCGANGTSLKMLVVTGYYPSSCCATRGADCRATDDGWDSTWAYGMLPLDQVIAREAHFCLLSIGLLTKSWNGIHMKSLNHHTAKLSCIACLRTSERAMRGKGE